LVSGPQGSKRRVTAENGKNLIVDSVGNVFLEETDDDGDVHEFLIDVNEIHKPTIKNTVLVQLPLWAWRKTGGKLLGHVEPPTLNEDEVAEETLEPALQSATATTLSNEAARRRNKKVRQRP